MQNMKIQALARVPLVGVALLILALPRNSEANDPLDDRDGTEGWDQVVDPQPRRDRDLEAERDAFKKEVADWEGIRQLWQTEREGYIREKTNHTTLQRKWKRHDRKPQVQYDDGDWGDQSGQEWFETTTSNAIDEELGESGATGNSAPPAPLLPPQPPPESGTNDASALSPFRQSPGSAPSSAEQQRQAEEAARIEAARRRLEQQRLEEQEKKRLKAEEERRRREEEERRRRKEEEERRRKVEEERRRKEAEAEAGAAAAAELLRQQEEQMRKEQEALRKKAKLETDEDGQVVDPDLAQEIEDEDEEE